VFSDGLVNPSLIADVGTGSGVLAVTLALRFPGCLIVGSDISMEALAIASGNRLRHQAENLELVAGDLLEPFMAGRAGFDGMVANLPYVPSREIQDLQPEVSEGDPRLALDGGPDGLRLVERFLGSAGSLLLGGGFLALELGTEQTGPVRDAMTAAGIWKDVSILDDLTGRPRFVTARKRDGGI
jgi:release factor glutamine methyltransferase